MIRNEAEKAVFFDTLVWNQREEVIAWLRFKYSNLSYADAEDIYQEASIEFWKKYSALTDWGGEDMTGMLKVFCRNVHGHWIRGQVYYKEWDDKYYPQDDGVETDYGYVSSEIARMMLKERMYEMIEHLTPKDRSLMEMYLQKVRMDKIAQQLGFRSSQVARNRKTKIVVKLCKEINAQAIACASYFLYIVNILQLTHIIKKNNEKTYRHGTLCHYHHSRTCTDNIHASLAGQTCGILWRFDNRPTQQGCQPEILDAA